MQPTRAAAAIAQEKLDLFSPSTFRAKFLQNFVNLKILHAHSLTLAVIESSWNFVKKALKILDLIQLGTRNGI